MPPPSKPNPEVRDFVNDFLRRPPTIDLPKGGGAIRGIGEKFGANPVTGTASMTVPIRTSPGRSGFGPDLTLSYDSGNGNGPFGFGWLLPLSEVSCKTEKGLPHYEHAVRDSDTFVLGGSEDLVPALVASPSGWVDEPAARRTVDGRTYSIRRYRPRVEGSFARIERWTNAADRTDLFWRTISAANVTNWYGRSSNSRIADPDDASRIFRWLISEPATTAATSSATGTRRRTPPVSIAEEYSEEAIVKFRQDRAKSLPASMRRNTNAS